MVLMGIFADIIIVAILALNIIMGYKKGLVNVVFNIFAFLIAIVVTFMVYKPISEIIIKNTDIYDNIKSAIIKNNEVSQEKNNKENSNIQKYIQDTIQDTTEEAKAHAMEIASENIAIKVVEIITGIIIFILTRIILIVLRFLTETIASLPLIKQLNEVGGIFYGFARGLIIIYVILTILFFVISINENGKVANIINSSYITKFLYDNNIIVNYCLLGKNLL